MPKINNNKLIGTSTIDGSELVNQRTDYYDRRYGSKRLCEAYRIK